MRKLFCYVLALTFVLTFAACGAEDEPLREPVPQPEALTEEDALRISLQKYAELPAEWEADGLNYGKLQYTVEREDASERFNVTVTGGTETVLSATCSVDADSGEVLSFEHSSERSESFRRADEAEAKASALTNFGLSERDVSDLTAEFVSDEYFERWYVSFTYDGEEYECELLSNGEFYTSNMDIGHNGALNAALNDFYERADNSVMREDFLNLALAGELYDRAVGRIGRVGDCVYEVDFKIGGYGFSYTFDGKTGEVLSYERTQLDDWQGPVAGSEYSPENLLSEHAVLKIALEHGGYDISEVKNISTELSEDVYSVSFLAADKSVECSVNAYTGEILSYNEITSD